MMGFSSGWESLEGGVRIRRGCFVRCELHNRTSRYIEIIGLVGNREQIRPSALRRGL
jgi:hypothetical protein